MLLILAVWLLVNGATRRVLDRIRYLENFTKVCAWCRRVDFEGHWLPLEDFLKTGFDSTTSHGICKDCLEQKKAALNQIGKPSYADRLPDFGAEARGQET
jgi:hypothetical protein